MERAGRVWDAVGNTPLIRIQSLSEMTGCEIYGKAEFLNPGGSVKDRAAKGIILSLERKGKLAPGGTIVEGTAGNTGIGLATLAAERGYKTVIVMPDNQAAEKYQVLKALGAELRILKACPFSDINHFYHQARLIADGIEGAIWADQFENQANGQMHYRTTGPEIWEQLGQDVDIFITAVGTGGTLGGVSRFLKEKDESILTMAADCEGSGVHDYFKHGAFTGEGSSITEGIGIKRLTMNLLEGKVDDALRVRDRDMMDMLFHIAKHDGLFLGTSAALNLYAAYTMAKKYPNSHKNIVTVLCDHGSRYASKVLDEAWLKEKNLTPRPLK